VDPIKQVPIKGSVASFGTEQEFAEKTSFLRILGGHFQEFVDELILTPDATPAQPPHLALPNYVYRLISPESFVALLGIRETLVWRSLAV
jgi:hypothetical protein